MDKSKRINREQVQKKAGAAAYTRGATVYRKNKIQELNVDKLGDLDYLKAKVEGSKGETYSVFITYNSVDNYLEDAYCDCPGFDKVEGICKHCVATLLKYENCSDKDANRQNAHTQYNHALEMLEKMKGNYRKVTRPTTITLRELLYKERDEEVLKIIEEDNYGKVVIEPVFEFTRFSITIEFKIGMTRMYLIRDLMEFEKNMVNGDEYSYGKELEFRHSINMFDEDSVPLVRFIMACAKKNREEHQRVNFSYRHGYEYTYEKMRNITPTQSDLNRFFDAMGDRNINGTVIGFPETEWRVVEGVFKDKLKIVGDDTGITLTVNQTPQIATETWSYYFVSGIIHKVPGELLEPIKDFREVVLDEEWVPMYIQNDDIPSFIRTLLPQLKERYECNIHNFDPEDYGVLPVSFEFYMDMPQKDFLTMKALAVYGEEKFNIYDKSDTETLRDSGKESQIAKVIEHYTNAYDAKSKCMVLTNDDDLMFEVLTEGTIKLQMIGEVFISDALKKKEYSPKITIGLSLSNEKLEIKMTADEMSNDELFEILSKYERKKKFYRLKNGSFVNMKDESMQALLELKDSLGVRDAQLKSGTIKVPKFRALYLDNELRERNALSSVKDNSFKSLIRNMKTVEDNEFEVPETLDSILREYQKQGFYWLKTLGNNGFGGILADDMGLGKTLQVIAYIMSERKTTLVACPASLVFNWKNELEKYAPMLNALMVVGSKTEREEIIGSVQTGDILITSYDLLKRDLEEYESITFGIMVIDEAQFIKNHNTQVAKSVKTVDAVFKIALTGTPVENSLSELWSIFDFVMPGFLYKYTKFRAELETPIVQEKNEASMLRLKKMLRPFVIRRLKKDVLKDLPDKMEENYFAKLSGEQQKLYDGHVQRMKMMLQGKSDEQFKSSRIQILSELTKLRQICCDPELLYDNYEGESAKLELCRDLVNKAIAGGHKILLFSQFTSMFKILSKSFDEDGISYFMLTGATSKEKRAQLVDDFNAGQADIFCISLKAGGTGLNLTTADIVIHYDPWWNVAAQNQATDRAHRIGQKNVVSVYKLIAKGTIEESIMQIQEKKSKLADEILGGEGMSGTSFTREELLELL